MPSRSRQLLSGLAAPIAGTLLLAGLALPSSLEAASLRPGGGSIDRQNYQAQRHQFTYLKTASGVRSFVAKGYLVPVHPGRNHTLKDVSFPYARPEVKLFIERLSRQYRAACGEQLVVTSLTRPRNHQPPNASHRSVHPTGMALDLRRSWNRNCRSWLEHVLVDLEAKGILEATRERWPPHYHVALFPRVYTTYVERLAHQPPPNTHLVARGDTLWRIAQKHRTTVEAVKSANGLRSNRISPGQVLSIPTSE